MTSLTSYAYLGESRLSPVRNQLALQTSGGSQAHPQFFSGYLTAPAATAAGLLVLAHVALTRFDGRPSELGARDPVITAGDGRLRFEAFSACNGVYARLDLPPPALDGPILGHGTTNVDVNPPLRSALARVRGLKPLHLVLGPDELQVTTLGSRLVERRVALPARWLRGFTEAQALGSEFALRAQLDRPGSVSFLHQVPRSVGRRFRSVLWVVPSGRTLRMSARPTPGAIGLGGAARLAVALPFLRHITGMRAYGPRISAASPPTASSWELTAGPLRLTLTLSPESGRGFSGEGAALEQLTSDESVDDADLISALLAWDTRIDLPTLSAAAGLTPQRVRAALSVLATAGRVGYDAAEAAYFHRALPYPTAVEHLNPRLRRARDLIANREVRLSGDTAVVSGRHFVRVTDNKITCTCAWWQEYRGGRGPCAHALAFRLARLAARPRPVSRPSPTAGPGVFTEAEVGPR